MPVPLLDLNAQNSELRAELEAAFSRVLDSGRFILGPEVEAFESEIAAIADTAHAVGVSSGTDAILLALMALDVGPGDEVLCPTFTFFATAGCIARTGATPVFVDADPETFNLDLEDAAGKISAKTKAIIPVHLFGQAADMDGVMALAQEHGLAVIEDAAQSLGAGYKGRPVGGIGTFGTFSFFPSKNLGGFGDGGMLVCNDDALAEKARILRMHGSKPKYYHKYIGGNFRLDPLQAALLRVKLPHYASYTKMRQANAAYYTEKLSELPGVTTAGSPSTGSGQADNQQPTTLLLPANVQGDGHIWNQYTLRIVANGGETGHTPQARDALKAFLGEKDIGCEIYYPVPMHRQECFLSGFPDNTWTSIRTGSSTPDGMASRLADECLSIPVYPELTREQQDEVIAAVGECLAGIPTK